MPKHYQVQDKYFLMAKEMGYRARSAFKLKDIQQKFRLIKKGDTVVDLGAAPGSFMQVIREFVGEDGKLIGFDLQAMKPFAEDNMFTVQGDIFEKEKILGTLNKAGFNKVDVVTSDLAPKTSGIKDMDQGASAVLTDEAAFLASRILKPGGNFVGKFFEGADTHWLLRRMKRKFKTVNVFKPKSCRDRSFERFIVAKGCKK